MPKSFIFTGYFNTMIDLRLNYPSVKQEADIFQQYVQNISAAQKYGLLSPGPFTPDEETRRNLAAWLGLQPELLEQYSSIKTAVSGNSALYLMLTYLKPTHPVIAVEEFTYSNLKFVALEQGIALDPIACDEEGMLPEALAQYLQKGKAKIVYLQPTVHNPTCTVMSLQRREAIIQVVRSFKDVYVMEDDAYRFLHPSPPPNILTLMPERTIHVCSFSKNFNPFVRAAYIIYPKGMLDGLDRLIRITTSGSSELFNGFTAYLVQHAYLLRQVIAEKRKIGVELYEKIVPIFQGLNYKILPGSYHFWLQLPAHLKAGAFVADMRDKGIEIMSSGDFSPTGNQQFIRVAAGAVWSSPELLPALETIAAAARG